MNKKIKKYSILVAPLISIVIILGIYIFKGIYPFGNKTVFHADLASYTFIIKYIVDIFKAGEFGKLIFSDLIFGGTNIVSIISYLNPFLIIYFLCENTNKLLFFMSFVILIKVVLCSITSYICFDKIFGRDNFCLNIVFSLLYAFSSYALINYTTLFWIEIVILFPILIVGLKNIFEKQSFWLYSIVLAICIGINYQISYMILLSIIISVFVAIKVFDKFEDKKKIITALGIGTLLGILISSVILLPTIENFLKSARNNLESIAVDSNITYNKLSYILFSGILVFPLIEALKDIKKDKNVKFLVICIGLLGIIPIFFEGVNLIFHGGQYDQFPFRYGFIPVFFMNLLANYYYQKVFNNDKREKRKFLKIEYLLIVIAIFILIAISITTRISNPAFRIYPDIVILLIIYNVLIYGALKIMKSNGKLNRFNLIIFTVIEITIVSSGFIGIDENFRGRDHSDISILNGIEIIEELNKKLDFNSGYKYKDLDNLMIENTSLYTKLPSTAAWIYSNDKQINSYTDLGYSQLYMRLNSTNGTIFSDALLGMKYILTQKELDESIYNYVDTTSSGIRLYEYKNPLSIGVIYDDNQNINEIPENMNCFEYQNWIYKNLFNKNDNILEKIETVVKSTNGECIKDNIIKSKNKDEKVYVEYEVNINKPEILYFWVTDEIVDSKLCIKVNDKNLNVPATNHLENEYYPNPFNNGILNLGYYENETVNIKIYFLDELDLDYLKFAKLDYSKYKEISENRIETSYKCEENIVTITTNVEDNKKIFIPITYDKNWIATVNGKEVEVEESLGGMISVDLEKGKNEIKLIYTYPLIKISGIISIVSLILLIILEKCKDKILNIKLFGNICYYSFAVISVIMIIYIYFWGIISTFL